MVVFDKTALLLTIFPNTSVQDDTETGQPISEPAARIEYALKQLGERNERVAVPTPVLSEVLIRAGGHAATYVAKSNASSRFEIVSFDQRAAIEIALMAAADFATGDKRGGSDQIWAKVKYDRQIVAIAKVIGASAIYGDDKGIARVAGRLGLPVIRLAAFPLPPTQAQTSLKL